MRSPFECIGKDSLDSWCYSCIWAGIICFRSYIVRVVPVAYFNICKFVRESKVLAYIRTRFLPCAPRWLSHFSKKKLKFEKYIWNASVVVHINHSQNSKEYGKKFESLSAFLYVPYVSSTQNTHIHEGLIGAHELVSLMGGGDYACKTPVSWLCTARIIWTRFSRKRFANSNRYKSFLIL
jgi:hypothetical protein